MKGGTQAGGVAEENIRTEEGCSHGTLQKIAQEELSNMYSLASIIRMAKSRRM
jgi:hypothetical protein